jgi:hypothetical protein
MSSTDYRNPASYVRKKWGVFAPFTNTADGDGILQGVPALYGSWVSYGIDSEGTYTELSTTSTINSHAGYMGTYVFTRTSFNPSLRCKFAIESIADCRIWVGLCEKTFGYIPAGDDGFNGKSGFALSMRANETNWQLAHNDGTGATVFNDVDDGSVPGSVTPIPVDTNINTVEMAFNSGKAAPNQFDFIFNDSATVQSINTDIPLTTDNLTFVLVIENSVASIKKIRVYWLEVLSDK